MLSYRSNHRDLWYKADLPCVIKLKFVLLVGSPHCYNLVPVTQDSLSWEAVGNR